MINTKLGVTFLLCGICLLVSCSSEDPSNGANGNPNWELTGHIDMTRSDIETVDGINKFSYKLMEEACKLSEDGGFCVSPISISLYLGMLANASDGDCRGQILSALGSENINDLNTLSRKLMQYLPYGDNRSSLEINNHFWVARHNNVSKDFSSVVGSYFNAGIEYVDFHKETTINAINKWIYDNTSGKIPVILDQYWENYRDTEMICANAVYFKGNWESKFPKDKTAPGKFYTSKGAVDVEMMHRTLNAVYFENETARYVILNFEGYGNAMELYLPSDDMDLHKFVGMLSSSEMTDLYKKGEYCEVTLSMPSFNKSNETDIFGILSEIGIPALDNADLSPMGLKNMAIVPVHKTSIKVDEEGAELAAVTANVGDLANVPEDYKEVTLELDRPFVYVIRNRTTDAILMAGVVADPR